MVLTELGKRKVHEVGGPPLIVLPRAWARTVNLRKGEKVVVRITEGSKLVIDPLAVVEA